MCVSVRMSGCEYSCVCKFECAECVTVDVCVYKSECAHVLV